MKWSIFIAFTFTWVAQAVGQGVFPHGVYQKVEHLRSKTPSHQMDITVHPDYALEIGRERANNFSLSSDSMKFNYLNKWVYAYKDSTGLYLNGWRHDRHPGFALCHTEGNFLVFDSPLQPEMNPTPYYVLGSLFGLVGGLISAAVHERNNSDPVVPALFVLSLRTGNVRLFTKEYLLARLQDHPSLLKQFNDLSEYEQDERMLDYIHILNHITPIE